ncbi:MAG: hypothetical protein J5851_00390 [Oscillospiraceae bacterium]|nr:hypothetical protein [Oscillospiraceae bacterium]
MKIKVIGKNDGYAAEFPMRVLAVKDVLDRVSCEQGEHLLAECICTAVRGHG